MARRSEHSQAEIKTMVLEAAEEIVHEQGFSALKVRKIAADIGYTVGSIYMVFSNMNDLHLHIKARTWQKLCAHLQTQEQHPVTLASIEASALDYLDFTVLNKGLWCMLFEHQLPITEMMPDWYLQETAQPIDFFEQLLKQLHSSHTEKQIQQAAQSLLQAVQGVCVHLLVKPASPDNIALAKADMLFLVECFMCGFLKLEQGAD
ncbi:MAG: TetR family transcriptional regulator [Methyloprofundus sp.]|nr:TetR family transcriptional regulator [Methyloprofundus sp.]